VVIGLLPDWPIGPAVGIFAQQLTTALAGRNLTFLLHPKAQPDRPLRELFTAIAPAAVLLFDGRDWRGLDAVDVVIELPLGRPRTAPDADADPSGGVGRAQVDHLVGRGHQRLGFAMPDDPRLAEFADARLTSVRKSCAHHRLRAPIVRRVPLTARGAIPALKAWQAKDVTAVCAYNDDVALAVLAGMHALQLHAPRLAVIGVDDIPAAVLAAPALTTISFDIGRAAQHTAELIACRIARRPDPPPPAAPGGLRVIHREST